MLALLRHREFAWYYAARTFSAVGDMAAIVALSFAVLRLDGSASDIAFVLAARSAPNLVLPLVGGVLGDRSRRSLLIWCDLVRVATQAATSGLVFAQADHIMVIALLQFTAGAAGALFVPASAGVVPHLVPAQDLHKANGLLMLSQTTGSVLAAAASGLVVAAVGPGLALAFDAGTFLISAVCVINVSALRVVTPSPVAGLGKEFVAGWQEFRRHTAIWVYVGYASGLNLLVSAPVLAIGPYMFSQSRLGAAGWGLATALMAAGSGIGVALAQRGPDGASMSAAIAITFAMVAFPVALVAHLPVGAMGTAALLFGLPLGFSGVAFSSFVQRSVPIHLVSRVFSYSVWGAAMASPAGSALTGILLKFSTSRVILLSAVSWLIAATPLAWYAIRLSASRRSNGVRSGAN